MLQTDKFVPFCEVWDHFIINFCTCCKHGAFITTDEQPLPSKVRCPFTQFMASKPEKFGKNRYGQGKQLLIKVFLILERMKHALQMTGF